MNDSEREQWVLNDEGRYNAQRRSRQSMRAYIRANREMIDQHVAEVCKPLEKTWRDLLSLTGVLKGPVVPLCDGR